MNKGNIESHDSTPRQLSVPAKSNGKVNKNTWPTQGPEFLAKLKEITIEKAKTSFSISELVDYLDYPTKTIRYLLRKMLDLGEIKQIPDMSNMSSVSYGLTEYYNDITYRVRRNRKK